MGDKVKSRLKHLRWYLLYPVKQHKWGKKSFYIKINVVGKNSNRPLEKEENRWKMRAMCFVSHS